MNHENFERFLKNICKLLEEELRGNGPKNAFEFEKMVRATINSAGGFEGQRVALEPKPQEFPDIPVGKFGIEVKFTENDTWRSIANSVSEGSRNLDVESIYVIFAKMGGTPAIRFANYEDVVMHVRTSHVPRFEIEMGTKDPLFKKFGINYRDFQKLGMPAKMEQIRKYARARLKPGERLWWLEDGGSETHALPIEVRLYMHLSQHEKRKLRAEATLLFPKVVGGSRIRNKYNDVVVYALTQYGILCPQARDLFTAGSVANKNGDNPGGHFLSKATKDIEFEMKMAAVTLDDKLFLEYWGRSVAPEHRIGEWLKQADKYATDWIPSDVLFL